MNEVGAAAATPHLGPMSSRGTNAVRVAVGSDGTTSYLVAIPPDELPPVRSRDLAAAWDAARDAAGATNWGQRRLFRFSRGDGQSPDDHCIDLALADSDACCWAAAVDATLGLGHAYGMSVCLRLLALIDLMASANWVRSWFALKRDGAEIDAMLLEAAATQRLTPQGRLDEAALRRRLPRPALSHPFPGALA